MTEKFFLQFLKISFADHTHILRVTMKFLTLMLVAFVEINNSFSAFSGLLQHFKQSGFIAELVNQRHTARVESNLSNYC